VLHLLSASIHVKRSLVDYLKNGLELNFSVAVDFTGSNGSPTSPSSLHYMNPMQPNQYVNSIRAVGHVIQDYDTDKMFPALGYGAKLPDGSVSHHFSLTGNEQNPYCAGVEGIVAAYSSILPTVQLWGPTNFAPVINQLNGFATAAHNSPAKGSAYFILVILTDGVITDMSATKDAIVASSHLPMSIIIIGVGNANFDMMEELDGDGTLLKNSQGISAQRDLVQFVPYKDFASNQASLAREVLHEIPEQVCQYMSTHGSQTAA